MNTRHFDGLPIGEIGLGCWQIGGSWGEVSDETALEILRAAYESGVTFFDTADVYGAGRSERLIARWRREDNPQGIFVATKQGRFSPLGGPENVTLPVMRQHIEASLTRLNVDALDLVQLHCVPTEVLRNGEVFESLRTLRAEGKIRRFGASVESMEEAQLCLAQDGLVSLQIIFNLFRQKPIEALFADAKAREVAIIVRLPLASGLLSGKFTAQTVFPDGDHRNFNRDGDAFNVGETFAGLPFPVGVALAEEFKALLPEGMNLADAAQRWCLDFDAVTVLIPGASRPEQARRNAAVSRLSPLSIETHAALRRFYDEKVAMHIRGPY